MATDPRLTLILAAKDLASREVGKLHSALNGIHGISLKAGGALKSFGGHIVNLGKALARVGLAAFAVGLAAVEETIRRSVGSAENYGIAVARVASITKESTVQASRLVAVFQKYGLEGDAAIRTIGMLEKNVGTYTATTKAAAKFTAEFGFKLRDSNGHIKNATTLIGQAADYFNNKHIPASKKALLEAKLFGRQWQALVPILSLGSKGIAAAGDEAAKLGLVLSKSNANELLAYRKSTIGLKEAWGGFQLQLGLLVMPILEKVFGFISTTAIPAIRGAVSGIQSWFKQNAPFIDQMKVFAGQVLANIGSALTYIVPKIIDFGRGLFDTARKVASFVVPKIQAFLKTLTGKGGVFDSVGKVVGPIVQTLLPKLGDLATAFATIAGKVGDLVGKLWGDGKGPLAIAVKGIAGVFGLIVDVLSGPVAGVIDNFVGGLGMIIDQVNRLLGIQGPGKGHALLHKNQNPGTGGTGTNTKKGGAVPRAMGGPMFPGGVYRMDEGEHVYMGARGGFAVPARGGKASGLTLIVQSIWPPSPAQVKAMADALDHHAYYQTPAGTGNRT